METCQAAPATANTHVDVAIIGAGLCGLATAAALHQVRPDLVTKVYEQRPQPRQLLHESSAPAASSISSSACHHVTADDADTSARQPCDDADSSLDSPDSSCSGKVGGAVRLEVNGLKALAAIDRRLAAQVMAEGLFSRRVMLHDIEGGPVITRLQDPPHLASPSAHQAPLVIGWSELETLMLQHLPPDTVQWGCLVAGYQDQPAAGRAKLQVLTSVPGEGDTSVYRGKQRWFPQGHHPAAATASAVAGSSTASTGAPAAPLAQAAAAANRTSPTGPAESSSTPALPATRPAVSPFQVAAGSADHDNHGLDAAAVAGINRPCSLGGSGSSGQGSSPTGPGWDGFEAAAVGANDANDAAHVAETDAAHPQRRDDQTRDQSAKAAVPEAGTADSNSNRCIIVHAHLVLAADGALSLLRQQCVSDGPPRYDSTMRWVGRLPGDLLSTLPVSCEAWWLSPGSTFNSHPLSCGDVAWEAQVSSNKLADAGFVWDEVLQSLTRSDNTHIVRQPAAVAAVAVAAPAGVDEDAQAAAPNSPAAKQSAQELLQLLFAGFPTAVRSMIAATQATSLLEAAVHTRAVSVMPPCLGEGSVALMGQAAHPLRPTGQDVSQAFEDAAVLGAAVMLCGCSREALRQFEVERRSRWKHVMQVSQVLGSCSNLGGVSLHQGLLDYTTELYHMRFVPLRSVVPHKQRSLKRKLLRLAGASLLAYSCVTGLSMLLPQRSSKPGGQGWAGPFDRVIAEVENTSQAVSKAVSGVAAAAVRVPSEGVGVLGQQLKHATQISSKVEHGLGQGMHRAARTLVEVADETAGAAGGTSDSSNSVVHGAVGSSGDKPTGPLSRFKDAVLSQTLAAGSVVSRPFARLVRHRLIHEVATHLGAF